MSGFVDNGNGVLVTLSGCHGEFMILGSSIR